MSNIKGLFIFVGALVIIFVICIYATDSLNLHPLHLVPNLIKKKLIFYQSTVQDLEGNEEYFIKLLQEKYLLSPSKKAYNLSEPLINPSMGQAQKIDRILNRKENGFYIECGALDGEARSNTLFFERERNWSGLLIEADPKNVVDLVGKHRKAYISNSCLAPSEYPQVFKFEQQSNMGHILGEFSHGQGTPESEIDVQCFPLEHYLKALNVSSVDYFSLDVEGAEFSILKKIPFERLDIRTLSVEFIHDKASKDDIKEFMEGKGYVTHSEVIDPQWLANDFIFVRKDIFDKIYGSHVIL